MEFQMLITQNKLFFSSFSQEYATKYEPLSHLLGIFLRNIEQIKYELNVLNGAQKIIKAKIKLSYTLLSIHFLRT